MASSPSPSPPLEPSRSFSISLTLLSFCLFLSSLFLSQSLYFSLHLLSSYLNSPYLILSSYLNSPYLILSSYLNSPYLILSSLYHFCLPHMFNHYTVFSVTNVCPFFPALHFLLWNTLASVKTFHITDPVKNKTINAIANSRETLVCKYTTDREPLLIDVRWFKIKDTVKVQEKENPSEICFVDMAYPNETNRLVHCSDGLDSSPISTISELNNSHSITIKNVKESDAGIYFCQVTQYYKAKEKGDPPKIISKLSGHIKLIVQGKRTILFKL